MSIAHCQRCGRLVDTDEDTGAYYQEHAELPDEALDDCRCEECRNEVYNISEQQGYK